MLQCMVTLHPKQNLQNKTDNFVFIRNELQNNQQMVFVDINEARKHYYIYKYIKNSKRVCSGKTTITNCRQTRDIVRKSHTTIKRQQEYKQSKATSSLFPIEMIAKLERTHASIRNGRITSADHNLDMTVYRYNVPPLLKKKVTKYTMIKCLTSLCYYTIIDFNDRVGIRIYLPKKVIIYRGRKAEVNITFKGR